ncbi:hypothetical protein ANCCAN_18554 [Ancylostoma caninum]|uniref:G protein-coupled receptor n=1 Tax=Ancylostoma caninum TaxID=29170 RepID=A0A368FZ36_ANCCA|nr:hypothetical protein ANCCAN_18554 [Ancylostoma caninum]
MNSKNYEKCGSVGVLLVAAKLLTSLSIFIGFHLPELSIDGLHLFCSRPKRSDLFKLIPCLTVMTFQVLSVISIRILKHVNQRLAEAERRKPHLRIRYNLDESLRTICVITPFIYASCIFIFTFMAFITGCIGYRTRIDPAVYIPLIEGLNWLPEYALLAPLILLYVDRRIILKKKIDLQQLMNTSKSDDVGRIYFASLVTAWNNPANEDNPHLYRVFPTNSIAPAQS